MTAKSQIVWYVHRVRLNWFFDKKQMTDAPAIWNRLLPVLTAGATNNYGKITSFTQWTKGNNAPSSDSVVNALEQPQINLLQKLVNPRNTQISRKDLGIGYYLIALTLVSSILILSRPTTNPRNSTVSVSKTYFLRFTQSQYRSSLSRTYRTASVQASGSSEKINMLSKQTTQLILTSLISA